MRSFTLVLLLALLAVCVSARLSPSSFDGSAAGVNVPYKWCGSSTDDATIDSIVSNEFPPVRGDTLSLNVTGNLTKAVTSGTYTIAIAVSGFPLPDITGDIDAFHPLPWALGELNFTYAQDIPSVAPAGSYVVKISAVDQDSKQIFCIQISFTLSLALQQPGQANLRLHSAVKTAADTYAEEAQLAIEAAASKPEEAIARRLHSSNLRMPKPQFTMPAMKPVKRINRRL